MIYQHGQIHFSYFCIGKSDQQKKSAKILSKKHHQQNRRSKTSAKTSATKPHQFLCTTILRCYIFSQFMSLYGGGGAQPRRSHGADTAQP